MKSVIRKALNNIGIVIYRDENASNELWKYGISKDEWKKNKEGYFLKTLNIIVSDKYSALIKGYYFAKKIAEEKKGIFSYNEKKELLLTINGINFLINNSEELYIIHEVYIEECYNFLSHEDGIIIIDIGLNVGITSLYFASRKNIKRVYGFELFPSTYELALNNIKINTVGAKIIPSNVGLGKSNQNLTLDYSPDARARMGTTGIPKGVSENSITKQNVKIEDVSYTFNKIKCENPNSHILCKIDCEGGEYDILERLFETNTINIATDYIIEWHIKDTSKIEENFIKNGFKLIKTTFSSLNSGMIYAHKMNNFNK